MNSEEILAEHYSSASLSARLMRALMANGVPVESLSWSACGRFLPIHQDRVVFGPRGDFEFARYLRDAEGCRAAIVIPLLSEFGEVADLLAWRPGQTALWLRSVAFVGEEQVLAPRPDLGDALDVHLDVLNWLRAGRNGIVVLDHARAAAVLDGTTLRTATAEHARRLRFALARPAPRIVVRERAVQLGLAHPAPRVVGSVAGALADTASSAAPSSEEPSAVERSAAP